MCDILAHVDGIEVTRVAELLVLLGLKLFIFRKFSILPAVI